MLEQHKGSMRAQAAFGLSPTGQSKRMHRLAVAVYCLGRAIGAIRRVGTRCVRHSSVCRRVGEWAGRCGGGARKRRHKTQKTRTRQPHPRHTHTPHDKANHKIPPAQLARLVRLHDATVNCEIVSEPHCRERILMPESRYFRPLGVVSGLCTKH
jgi:hypothetical protein